LISSSIVRTGAAVAALSILSACAVHRTRSDRPGASNAYILSDAEQFAALIDGDRIPDSTTLQREYLAKGTPGIAMFTQGRIENSSHLADVVSHRIEKYRHAARLCLPVARTMAPEARRVLSRVAQLLGERDSVAPTYIVFGADNSGGHAEAGGLVIGLEVICNGKTDPADVRQTLRQFFAHEVTHTYQARVVSPDLKPDLLVAALAEGVPDFVMTLALDSATRLVDERAIYGAAHERELWREFMADYNARVFETNDWMYTKGRGGRPADLGYWIGMRIAESFYARASDKAAALRTLLELKDSAAILRESGYGVGW
jgi:hypothetical protein